MGHQHLVVLFGVRLPFVLDHHGPVAVRVVGEVQDVVLRGAFVLYLVQDRLDPVDSILTLGVAHHVSAGLPVDPRVPHAEPAFLVEDLPVGDGPLVVPAPGRTRPEHRIPRVLSHRVERLVQTVEGADLQHVQKQHLPPRLRVQFGHQQRVEVDATRGGLDGERHSQGPGPLPRVSFDGVEVAERRRPGGLLVGDGVPAHHPALVGSGEPGTQPAGVEAVASGGVGPEDPGHAVLVAGQDGMV